MNETETAKKITGYLDHGTAELKAGVAFRLQRARQLALSQLSAQPQRVAQLALAGSGAGTFGTHRFLAATRLGIGALLLAGGVLAYNYWEAAQQARDIEETDAAILSSELPIEAYLDQGFEAWLKHSEP